MVGDMLVAAMVGQRKIEMRRFPIPQIKPNELLVKMKHCGVCGSDVHGFASGGKLARIENDYFILGHEAAGEVVEIGSAVTGFSVGDLVALEPGMTCGECEYCKKGLYNLCPNVVFKSANVDGMLSEYLAHPASLCFKLAPNMTTLQGALIEPLAVGLHGAELAGAQLGMDAVVFGCGCIGLVTMLSLRAMGVSRIAMVDVMDIRLKKAKELGADLTINSIQEDVVQVIADWTNGRGTDVALDASGSPIAIGKTEKVVKRAGTIVLVGNPSGPMTDEFSLARFVNREITLKGVFRYRNLYPTAIQAVAAGTIPVEKVADKVFSFTNTQQAFDESLDHKDTLVKAVIEIEG